MAQDAASPPDARRHAPAARRNREPISRVLAEVLPAAGLVVEVAAGTGEHAVHIAPWEACVGLMAGAAEVLVPGGPLFLYGPFMRDGQHTAPSNETFDASLRATDPRFGVRDLGDVAAEAAAWGLDLERHVAMPANNLSVVFRNSAERIPGRRVRGAHAPPHVSS